VIVTISRTDVFCDGTVRFNAGILKSEPTGILTIAPSREHQEPGTKDLATDYKGERDVVRIFFTDVRSVDALIACAQHTKERMLAALPNPEPPAAAAEIPKAA